MRRLTTVDSVRTVGPFLWYVIGTHHMYTGDIQVCITRVWQSIILYPGTFITNISDRSIKRNIPVILLLQCDVILWWRRRVIPWVRVRMATPKVK